MGELYIIKASKKKIYAQKFLGVNCGAYIIQNFFQMR